MALLELLLGGDGVEAPEVVGIPDLRPIVLDEEVDWPLGRSFEESTIPARVLQEGTEVAAGVGVAPAARLRRLATAW